MRQIAAEKTRILEVALAEDERKEMELEEHRQSKEAAALPPQDTQMNSASNTSDKNNTHANYIPTKQKIQKKNTKTSPVKKRKKNKKTSSSDLVRGNQQDEYMETERPSTLDTGRSL